MQTCPRCGAYIPDGGRVCLSCGWKPENNNETVFTKAREYYDKIIRSFPMLNDILTEEQLLAALSYIGPCFAYTGFRAKATEFEKYHANQGGILFGISVLSRTVKKVPVIGKPAGRLCRLGRSALTLIGVKNALSGEFKPLPYIGELKIKIIG